jgi:SAM-dependent methyltransferase
VSFYSDRIFPHLLALASRRFEHDRREVLAGAHGRVLELGIGNGASLGHYPVEMTDLVGIDPSRALLERSRQRLRLLERRRPGLPYRVRLHQADAQALPYRDGSFDTVVAFLTLCTVPDAGRAAAEAHRVLRPGGTLLVLEHVRAESDGWLARWQDRLDPLWTRAAQGCHLNRDTAAALASAGFETSRLHRYRDQVYFPLASPRLRGTIRKRDGRRPRPEDGAA